MKLLLWLRRFVIDRFSKVDLNAKCPGCGHRLGRIQADPARRLIVHTCLVCRAQWGEKFIAHPDAWMPRMNG